VSERPAGVVLAAGAGTRVRPLSLLRPKALFPVAGTPLLDRALELLVPHLGAGPGHLAVNAHHLAEQVVRHVGDRAHVQVEQPQAHGTAGALGALAGWLDGRDAVVLNADAYLAGADPVATLLDGWDGVRSRLLVVPADAAAGRRTDFADARGGWAYVGACLLPAAALAGLRPEPTGLYEVLWRHQDADGALDLVPFAGTVVDCGTPRDYLRANLHASGGHPVVGQGAVVLGTLVRSVVWDGAVVGAHEHLVDTVRAGTADEPVTVPAGG
jgi:MurNAc alpha-1-phosphate uridylyltransferase